MQNDQSPDYVAIYRDIIRKKYPEKKEECNNLLQKQKLTAREIILLNTLIFGKEEPSLIKGNSKFRSYDRETVQYIIEYQNSNKLNLSQTAKHFKMSRNTLAKWRKDYLKV
ncbi:transposase [Chryseobacterium sp. CH21]|uniref:helix-turn-helix domain-containing protein n=1 Tax=Chryseobacterium sp. CH21 TaxID=713556 RepID=UPI00100BD293|nr:helix-turn-helix domain-containing protein [Chryseobacterium sp. CH21]RXM41296.1 transposase [Chryseobacterium sp. CH21]